VLLGLRYGYEWQLPVGEFKVTNVADGSKVRRRAIGKRTLYEPTRRQALDVSCTAQSRPSADAIIDAWMTAMRPTADDEATAITDSNRCIAASS